MNGRIMPNHRKTKKMIVIPLLIFAFLLQGTQAHAGGGRKSHGSGGGSRGGGDNFHGGDFHGGGGVPHWAWGNPYWGCYSYGSWFAALPLAATAVALADATYFYYEGAYYQRMENGYGVVPAPVDPVVTIIPSRYQPTIINEVSYYDLLP